MPHVDGFQILREIGEMQSVRRPSVIVLTGLHDRQTRLETLRAGARDFLTKPFDLSEVCVRVRNLLQMHRLTERLSIDHRVLSAVLDATHDAIAMFDPSRKLVFANQQYRVLLRAPQKAPSDVEPNLSSSIHDLFQRPRHMAETEAHLFAHPDEMYEDTVELRTPSRRILRRLSFPVHDDGADIIGRLFCYRDVSREYEARDMRPEVHRLRKELGQTELFARMIGQSVPMQELYRLTAVAVDSDITVLVQGESGVGKELVAKSLHYAGPRTEGPFVAVNCAAIPEPLVESELFGHEAGSFTGATTRRIGKFEQADGGTIFLDEVGDMPLALQSKLLRVLENLEVERVGGERSIPVDVRIVSASNKDLDAFVEEGSFRADLYYRLAEFALRVPPLRERREDIPLLVEHFIAKHQREDRPALQGVAPGAYQLLCDYDWPGNVRELESAIKRAMLVETSPLIRVESLPGPLVSEGLLQSADSHESGAFDAPDDGLVGFEEAERRTLLAALELMDYSASRCAEALHVSLPTLYRKMRKHGIQRPSATGPRRVCTSTESS
ncbi:MAG: sigma 54-interacting transcriptional regulator [Chloroflexi bacterium]|nr:sigma 54-interacting transcriptional regulator [Chloroflexota bacterium]